MRMYTEAPLHAKVYIVRKDEDKIGYYGSVITGSSNFSEAGLQNNLEFNVELNMCTVYFHQFGYIWSYFRDLI